MTNDQSPRAARPRGVRPLRCPRIIGHWSLVIGSFLLIASASAADGDFRAIFNGRDLSGWDGDRRYWSVRDHCLRGETTLAALPVGNTFLIWRGGTLQDFELRLTFRLRNGNSGVQYRCKDLGKWVVSGYQAEIENKQGKAGFLYEEKARGWLARVGEKVEAGVDGKPKVTGELAKVDALIAKGYYRMRDWNDYRIVARGNHLQHWLNGFQTIDFTDNDPKRRALDGLLALQIHVGPPMLVEFKDILLKNH
ncbi:MAG: DUF1080 domain-containing protein [Chthoniobacteraceae bacterium]